MNVSYQYIYSLFNYIIDYFSTTYPVEPNRGPIYEREVWRETKCEFFFKFYEVNFDAFFADLVFRIISSRELC